MKTFIKTISQRILITIVVLTLVVFAAVGWAVVVEKIETSQQEFQASMSETSVFSIGSTLYVKGRLDSNTPMKFLNELETAVKAGMLIDTVELDSIGGNAYAGLKIANYVQKFNFKTYAPETCNSACTMIFVAGRDRHITTNTVMGFHSAGWTFEEDSYSKQDVIDFVAAVNEVSGSIMKLYVDNGISTSFVEKVQSTSFEDSLYLKHEELIKENIALGYK